MAVQYTCGLCKEIFIKKIYFVRHQKLCSLETETKMDNKSTLINLFKNCLNILRDNEGLTGEKALRNMSYLLILKLIEPRLDNIGIDTYNYDFSEYNDDIIEEHKKELLVMVRFSNLAKENNISNYIKPLWDDILSVHPVTKNIFLEGKRFDIQRDSTYKRLFMLINSLDLSSIEYDILGNAYEEVIQDVMTGKVLGQFFTPPVVKKLMVQLIDPQVFPDGSIETCCDPTMGTGGFLITYLKYIQQKTSNLDWDFIKTEGLYGKELEPDTYQLAVSNMLISSGHIFKGLDRGDSIRTPITKKFDNVLANPPFGIKGLKYDEISALLKNEYIPIKSDNAVSLFVQAIIYMLKINGKCAVVLPDGQDLFSKTNKTLIAIREFLLKTCDLKEIIYLPSGVFTYTSIKTCIFYFIKKVEGSEVLELIIKKSRNEKETRSYKFIQEHRTSVVRFYEYTTTKNLLIEVPIEKIASNSYSLKHSEYIETIQKQYNNDITIKTLGEICEIDKGIKKHDTSYGKNEGVYKFHTGGERTNLYVDEYDIQELYIIQNRTNGSGKCNLYLDRKFSLATQTIVYRSLNETTTKYIYYYLLNNKDIIENGFIGANHKNISKEYISNIQIPIPSLDRQEEIVKYLDFIEETNKISEHKISKLREINRYQLYNQDKFGVNDTKELGEIFICKMGKFNSNDMDNNGMIPFYSCKSDNPVGFHSVHSFDYPEYLLLICAGGSQNNIIGDRVGMGKCYYVNGKTACMSNVCSLVPKTQEYNIKYINYYLNINRIETNKKAHFTTNLGRISLDDIKSIPILVPSLDRQEEIVKYCVDNELLIKHLEQEINKNKEHIKQYINNLHV